MKITDYKTEYLIIGLIIFALFTFTFGWVNWNKPGMVFILGVIFPFLSGLMAIFLYLSEVVVYYNEKSDLIELRKPLHRICFESFERKELKELKLKWHIGGQMISFVSPISKKRYKAILNERAIYLIKTWMNA